MKKVSAIFCAAQILTVLGMTVTAATAGTVKIVTFTGSGGFGSDTGEVFGLGPDIDHLSQWVATFTYDIAGSHRDTLPDVPGYYLNQIRLSGAKMLRSTFSVNGVTLGSASNGGDFLMDYTDLVNNPYTDHVSAFNIGAIGGNGYNLSLDGYSVDLPRTLSFQDNYTGVFGDPSDEGFFDFDNGRGKFILGNGPYQFSIADVADETNGVPEPATWALATTELGLLGVMLHLRKRKFVA